MQSQNSNSHRLHATGKMTRTRWCMSDKKRRASDWPVWTGAMLVLLAAYADSYLWPVSMSCIAFGTDRHNYAYPLYVEYGSASGFLQTFFRPAYLVHRNVRPDEFGIVYPDNPPYQPQDQ